MVRLTNLMPTMVCLCLCQLVMGCAEKDKNAINESATNGTQNSSLDLKDVMDGQKSPPFACSFGKYEVITVPSKYTDHTYFKVKGEGLLINSGWLHTNTGSNPDIIYAVPKSSPIVNGTRLSAYCISTKNVPYEGKERETLDKAAGVVDFYLLENPTLRGYTSPR